MSGGVGLLGGMSGSSMSADMESGGGGLGTSLLGGGGGSALGASYIEMQPVGPGRSCSSHCGYNVKTGPRSEIYWVGCDI